MQTDKTLTTDILADLRELPGLNHVGMTAIRNQMSDDQRPDGIPASDFAMLAARIGQVAAAWAADTLALPEDLSKPMDPGTVERFAEDILRRVYRLRERAYAKAT